MILPFRSFLAVSAGWAKTVFLRLGLQNCESHTSFCTKCFWLFLGLMSLVVAGGLHVFLQSSVRLRFGCCLSFPGSGSVRFGTPPDGFDLYPVRLFLPNRLLKRPWKCFPCDFRFHSQGHRWADMSLKNKRSTCFQWWGECSNDLFLSFSSYFLVGGF